MFEIHWKHSINITQSYHKLNKYYDVSAPSIIVEEYYFTEFRWGRKDTNDTERSGHTIDVTTLMSTEKPMKLCWPMGDHECASAYDPGSHSHIESLTFLFWLRHLCKITQSAKSARRFATTDHTHNRVTPCNKWCCSLAVRTSFFSISLHGRIKDSQQHTRDQPNGLPRGSRYVCLSTKLSRYVLKSTP